MQLELEVFLGRRRSIARPAPPEAFDQAKGNAELARRRAALVGRITAEISGEGHDAGLGELRWYVLTATPGQERIAAAHLTARRFGFYLPTIDDMTYSPRGWRFRQRPIFPGYVFISSIGLEGRWRRALACPGVEAFVNRAGTENPAALPQSFIDEVRCYEQEENSRFDVIEGVAPGAPRKKSRKARRSYRIRKGRREEKRLP